MPDVQLDTVPSGRALVYVFNASGATLIKNNYQVKADGRRIADLPRSTYSVVAMMPGSHKLESAGRKVELTLTEGQRAFVVVAYRPEKSPFPLGPCVSACVDGEQDQKAVARRRRPHGALGNAVI